MKKYKNNMKVDFQKAQTPTDFCQLTKSKSLFC